VVSLAGATVPDDDESGPVRRRWRWRRRHELQPWTALAATALGAGLMIEVPGLSTQVAGPVAVLACAALATPLAFVWAMPLAMTAALWALAAGFDAAVAPLDTSFTAIGLAFVPPFVVAALATRPRAVAGLVACVLGELACFGPSGLADAGVVMVLAWVAGTVLGERGRLADQLHRNAALLAERRDLATRLAVVEERARLARELHDALGHSLTVVALQSEAARRLWHSDHDRAVGLVRALGATSRDGLADLTAGVAPWAVPAGAGSPAALDALVDAARSAGAQVEAAFEDVTALLTVEGRVAVHRVVQESVTNVLKHAPGAALRVTTRQTDRYVEVSVVNGPGGPAGSSGGSGHGLTGMRARVVACGGQLDYGPQPGGGFRVRATLPVTVEPVAADAPVRPPAPVTAPARVAR
jgi:signal transduction histidine kinase